MRIRFPQSQHSRTPGDSSGARKRLSWLSLLAALLLGSGWAFAASPDTGAGQIRLSGHVLPALANASQLAPGQESAASGGDSPLSLTFVLKRDDEAGFQQYLHDVYDAQSPSFRHFLTQTQIGDRFGPSQRVYDQVKTYLGGQNLAVVESSTNRLTVTASGARGDVERAFGLHIGDYKIGNRTFFANDRDPALPPALAPNVLAVSGLSNLGQPQALVNSSPPPTYYQCPAGVDPAYCDLYGPLCAIYAGSKATGEFLQEIGNSVSGMGVRDYVKSYNGYNKNVETYYANCLNNDFTDANFVAQSDAAKSRSVSSVGVPWLNVDGSGQTIGLVEFDQYQTSDIADFLGLIFAPASAINNLSEVYVGAGASFGAGEDEVVLDIDTVMSLATNAKVIVYSAGFPGSGSSFQRVFNKMLSDGVVTIISNSWAYCEDQTTLADVQSIDSILQTAAMSGISVFSGSGDSGSTCLDGAANTIAVPADAPHITAVGGTTLNSGAGGIYVSETWWDGANDSPPSGQGGFGISRYFAQPAYQVGHTGSPMRSVPDVSAPADPAKGIMICQADAGGCPTGLFYGGTSMAAPVWAAFTALLNQAYGSNLGFINPLVYPFATSTSFHNAASMGSDFAHVGLGSPNLNALSLRVSGQASGTPSANVSGVLPIAPPMPLAALGIPADGATAGIVLVTLRDASGNTAAGKTVTLQANAGNHATIAPVNSISSTNDGSVSFLITDLTSETLTFTATDSTDHIVLTQQPSLPFIAPPAVSASISAFPTTQTADGTSTSTVTVYLQDTLSRPSPGKQVLLSQNGNSVILGANPGTTGSNGEAQFSVTDQVQETAVYTAIDVTDTNLPVPGSASVVFSGGIGTQCGSGHAPVAGPGYAIRVYASGFPVQNGLSYGGINLGGCVGIGGFAFDPFGNLFVSNRLTGDVYKLPPGGGIADNSNKITSTPIGTSLGALAFGLDGTLYGARIATSGDFTTGAVLKIDPTDGAATPVATNLKCPFNLATDPLSGDVFVSDGCYGDGSDDPSILRISSPASANPSVSTYAETDAPPNGTLSFAPDGTLYAAYYYSSVVPGIDQISATNQQQPAMVRSTGIGSIYTVISVGSNPDGGAQSLVTSLSNTGGFAHSLAMYDMTASPPVFSGTTLLESGATGSLGPDGCIYLSDSNVIYKLGNADGGCPLRGLMPNPSIVINPETDPATAAQGSSLRFDSSFPHSSLPLGTAVTFVVSGTNSLQQVEYVGFGGPPVFTYSGQKAGNDTVVGYVTISGTTIASSPVAVTWIPGKDTTSINLNRSATSATIGVSAPVSATLIDISTNPATPIAGATIQFTLAGQSCVGTTDSTGMAACSMPVSALTNCTLTASYSGNTSYLAATASVLFFVSSYDVIFENGFEVPLQGGGCVLY